MIPLPVLEEITDRSGVAPRIEALLPIGVRARQLQVRTLLLGMLVWLGRVSARQGNGAVWQGLAASAVAWGRCHLVRHWQRASFTLRGDLGVVGTNREVVPLQA
jgi:hypothetical protein